MVGLPQNGIDTLPEVALSVVYRYYTVYFHK